MSHTSLHSYALALGSNRPLSARRTPARLVDEAIAMIGQVADVRAVAPTIITPPIGPSRRRFANSAIVIHSPLPPPAMLAQIHAIERMLGRRRGQRWGARSVDIDIILWSGGSWTTRRLTIPHRAFAERDFVLAPLAQVAAAWREPRSGLLVRHLFARLRKGTPIMVDQRASRL